MAKLSEKQLWGAEKGMRAWETMVNAMSEEERTGVQPQKARSLYCTLCACKSPSWWTEAAGKFQDMSSPACI